MNQIHEQLCPLCNSPATYYGVDADNLKYLNCPTCKYYLISWRAEDLVITFPFAKRQDFTRRAQLSPDGQVLLIIIPPRSQDPDVPSEPISASWVPKSNYRL